MRSSPRSWGCFRTAGHVKKAVCVFPTLVGVFLQQRGCPFRAPGLPHARGGVSVAGRPKVTGNRSSPRSWGCFFSPSPRAVSMRVFPTLVGVFPVAGRIGHVRHGLPHARGGVSALALSPYSSISSSPRSWGCFLFPPIRQLGHGVFPTLVGVFLLRDLDAPSPFGLPHARGGVSAKAVTAARHLASSPRSWGCFYR